VTLPPPGLASPVPTYSTFESRGSIASAPIDSLPWPSKIGVNVAPPSSVFHTPPLAAPT
jgi:hypothetical protein